MTIRQLFVIVSVATCALILLLSYFWSPALYAFVVALPIIGLGVQDMLQKTHSIRRLYPVFGRFRYMLEAVRPEIQQYFVESDLSGTPIPREFRSLVYQRAKGARDTRPFGTIMDVNRDGYEWMNHSLAPKHIGNHDPRILFGGPDCTKPYSASALNISAMSYGSLSSNAIQALSRGAKIGGFAHNTGEGSLSPHHLSGGADIIWQIGTGYFGCRDSEGNFNPKTFAEKATLPEVKMIEIKLSQGAKPGHGGLLPGPKVTEEIAAIRDVPVGVTVASPAAHSAFSTPKELLEFVKTLRELSGGKPIGFKMCLGNKHEFLGICKAMLETNITPDFITVDGGEGGTGAAPIEMTNSVGTPLRDGLMYIHNTLIGVGLRDRMRIIASGKMFSAFHIVRAMALGADTVNSARSFMLSLGCIQARSCNTDHCPTGIATSNPQRAKALVVTDKAQRVANYHAETVKNLVELAGAAGLNSIQELEPRHIQRRIQGNDVRTYAELYPTIDSGCLLSDDTRPDAWKMDWSLAAVEHF